MITQELKDWADEIGSHCPTDGVKKLITEAYLNEKKLHDDLTSPVFRGVIVSFIEARSGLRYPESMHLGKYIEDHIIAVVGIETKNQGLKKFWERHIFTGRRVDNDEWIYGGFYVWGDKAYIINQDIWDKFDSANPEFRGFEVYVDSLELCQQVQKETSK